MFKLLGMLVLLGAVFAAGYYVGKRPVPELQKSLSDLSRSLVDRTLGMQRDFRFRQSLLDAKAEVVQAKSELLDRNYGTAAKALAVAVGEIQQAADVAGDGGTGSKVKPLVARMREAHLELTMGKSVPRARLDEILQELDALLAKE